MEKFEAIYHCGDNENATMRIRIGDGSEPYPAFKSGVPSIVDSDTANILSTRDDFTVNPVMEKAPTKKKTVTKKLDEQEDN